jgi:DNA-binding PadR family transcriptional regulator
MRGDSTRLFLLAELTVRGEAHGHELRREAMLGKTELWSDVGIGAIYSTLRKLADEGLVDVVRTERSGQLPARTLYAITVEGRRELAALRDAMLRDVVIRPDPFDMAFAAASDVPPDRLAEVLDDRIAHLHTRTAELEHLRSSAADHLDARDHLLIEHSLHRLRAEIAWHQSARTTLTDTDTDTKETP